jgi:hypothetical protein
METARCIILRRNDLRKPSEDKPFIDIKYDDFRSTQFDDKFTINEIILFIDNKGETKVLKNRYGNQGVVYEK